MDNLGHNAVENPVALSVVGTRVTNTDQTFIETTEDKLRINLIYYAADLDARKAWVTPFGVFLATLTTLLTSTFKKALGLEAQYWFAIFFILCVGSGVWLIRSVLKAVATKCTVDKLIEDIKTK